MPIRRRKPAEESTGDSTEGVQPVRTRARAKKSARRFLAVHGDLVDPITRIRFPVAGLPVEVEDIPEGSWLDCQLKAGLLKEYN